MVTERIRHKKAPYGKHTTVEGNLSGRVCTLYNLNGTECAHMSSRKQKAEAHSRSKMHQKVGKNMVTIAEVLKKTDMYERENNEAFQRRQFKKGKIVHYIEQFRKCKK